MLSIRSRVRAAVADGTARYVSTLTETMPSVVLEAGTDSSSVTVGGQYMQFAYLSPSRVRDAPGVIHTHGYTLCRSTA